MTTTSDWAVVGAICGIAADRLADVLDALEVDLEDEGRFWTGPCPVHGGSSPQAFKIYPDGYESRGFWQCHTKHCHEHFPRSVLGFARGVLSRRTYDWHPDSGGRKVTHREGLRWLCDTLGIDPDDVKVDRAAAASRRLARDIELIHPPPPEGKALCTRAGLARFTAVPAPYFLARGYREETLRAFDVGTITRSRTGLVGRSFIPVFDDTHERVLGGIARSRFEECPACGGCHDGAAPCVAGRDAVKYLSLGGFSQRQMLYNAWRVAREVRRTGTAVLVEGAADVWRLHEAGVMTGLGLFGSQLHAGQASQLYAMGPRRIVVLTDDDDAGHRAAAEIGDYVANIVGRNNVRRAVPAGAKDVGGMEAADVRRLVEETLGDRT